MTTVLILASGEQARWEIGQGVKQFLPIETEPVITRIQRQVKDRGQSGIVVAHNPAIVKASWAHYTILRKEERRWIAEAIKTSRWAWEPRVIILLGDVVYSKALMDTVFEYGGPLRFWGTIHEIYAISFDTRRFTEMEQALDKAIHHAEFEGGPGKLRKVYQAIAGYSFDYNEIHHPYFEEVLHPDYTQDFDTVQEWHNFVREKLNPGRIDDLP